MDRMIGRIPISLAATLALGLGLQAPLLARSASTADAADTQSAAPQAGAVVPSAAPIVATIDDDVIRSDEVDILVTQAPVRSDIMDRATVARIMLDQLVRERLIIRSLGGAAMRVDPALPAAARLDQHRALLAACLKQFTATLQFPTDAEIVAYMADHPYAYARRWVYRAEQLRVRATPANVDRMQGIKPDDRLDAIAAGRTRLNIAFERGTGSLDTADLSPEMARYVETQTGDPFAIPKDRDILIYDIRDFGDELIYAVRGREPVQETPGETQRRALFETWRAHFLALLDERVKQARASARITYAKGFEPLPATPQPTPPVG